MHIHSENVKFIVVNLKENVIKIYFFILISFRLTMIKFTISGCVCTNTHIYIYILVPFFDNLHIIYTNSSESNTKLGKERLFQVYKIFILNVYIGYKISRKASSINIFTQMPKYESRIE